MVAGILCIYAIIAMIGSYFRWSHFDREFRERAVPEIRAALRDATVQVTSVRAKAVVTIEPTEHEGPGFIFDVENRQLFFLMGQDYWPVEETMPWPNSEFEIVRTAVGRKWIGIFCHGAPLNPTKILQVADCKEHVVSTEHEELVEASMDEFVRSIRKAA